MAKASFVISMIGIGFWLVLLFVAGAGYLGGADAASMFMVGVGLLMFAGIAVNIAASIMGIIALQKTISNKWMAVTGAIVNGVQAIGIIALMVIGNGSL